MESSRLVLVASTAAHGWYALGSNSKDGLRMLVGAGGYFGPPGEDGTVEIGYSVLPECQRQGYASEIVRILLAHAFTFPMVSRVIAHTSAENAASIKLLLAGGFLAAGAGEDPGTLRYESARPPATFKSGDFGERVIGFCQRD